MSDATYHNRPELNLGSKHSDAETSVDSEEVLSMLGDDYAQAILKAISTEPLPARKLAERLDLSRATVYRRLNRLEDAGIVESMLSYHPEGYHRKQFKINFDRLVLSIDTHDIDIDKT